jgi:yecA family protein
VRMRRLARREIRSVVATSRFQFPFFFVPERKWIHSVVMAAKRTPGEDLFTPLSDQEIDKLEAILEDIPDGLFDTSMVHGLLSGAAVAPTVIQPSWLYDSIFKPEGSPGYLFKDQEHVEATLHLVMRLQNQIIMELDADLFEPWLFFENPEGQTVIVLQPWCCGFLHATTFEVDAWNPLFEERPDLLAPILTGADSEENPPASPDDRTGTELSILIEDAVPAIRGFFRKRARRKGF